MLSLEEVILSSKYKEEEGVKEEELKSNYLIVTDADVEVIHVNLAQQKVKQQGVFTLIDHSLIVKISYGDVLLMDRSS